MKEQIKERRKLIIILLIIAFVFVAFYSISTLIYRIGKIKTSIYFAPGNATVTLNDKKISNRSDEWIIPGNYHLKVSFNEHFETYEEDIEISEDNHEFYGTLAALDAEGEEYIQKHREDFAKAEGLVGNLLSKRGRKIKETYPILNYLPINNSLYSISYQYDENQKPIINVKANPKYLDVAVSMLKTFNDIDLTTENIVFYNNPFSSTPNQSTASDYKTFLRESYQLLNNYKINDLKQEGDYYYTSFYIDDYNNAAIYNHYKIILTKTEDNWTITANPQPLFTIYNTQNIDKEILRTINSY